MSSGIVCCDLAGSRPEAVVKGLRDEFKILGSVSSSDAERRQHVRFSPSILNTVEDIDRTINAVEKIAAQDLEPAASR